MIGVLLWLVLLHSGIHPTLTGVLVAFSIPSSSPKQSSPLHRLENILHPWVAYAIMPLFALANAGFSLKGISFASLEHVVVLGIILGLFLGKQIGVFGFTWLMVKLRLASLPAKTSWFEIYGVAILCGIGFTMSLFLGTLSFQNAGVYLTEVRLGVLTGSLLSGIVGVLALTFAFNRKMK
jgi:NhaA family Na+:H+ antiporter